MKKNLLVVCCGLCFGYVGPVVGAYNWYQIAQSSEYLCDGALALYQMIGLSPSLDMTGGGMTMPGCADSDYFECWAYTSGSTTTYVPWYDCNTCQDGYTKKSTRAQMGGCGTTTYYYCEQNCTGCTNCTSDTSWSAGNTGYEKKVTRTCNCNTCSATTSYRCAAGYYGSSTNGTSGCTRCPSSGGVYGTSVAGSTTITDCYIPAGDISWTDDTGTYVCGEDSYYIN